MISDELLFEVHARRKGVPAPDRAAEREVFFAKAQACLRASPLVKQYGWGLHHDAEGKVAAYGVGRAEYDELSRRSDGGRCRECGAAKAETPPAADARGLAARSRAAFGHSTTSST